MTDLEEILNSNSSHWRKIITTNIHKFQSTACLVTGSGLQPWKNIRRGEIHQKAGGLEA